MLLWGTLNENRFLKNHLILDYTGQTETSD